MNTLKDYLDDFLVLPGMVKAIIYFVILTLLAVCLWQSVSNYVGNKKIERLEAENKVLTETAARAQGAAETSARQAADEHIRAENLQSQIPKIDKEIKTQDDKIKTQSQKSADIRRDLDGVRAAPAGNISTDDLESKLCQRYGNCQSANN